MGEPLLHVADVQKHFPVRGNLSTRGPAKYVHAVDGVTLTILEGETLAVVGESGSGKTTLANMILRLETPTSGQVLMDGKNVHTLRGKALREYRAGVQAVFQDPSSSLNPRMRVGEIVAESMIVNKAASKAEAQRRVADLLREVGLQAEHAAMYPHQFSGGQRQRIALASALATRPRLVVLDEPVSALDVSIRAQIINLLTELQRQRRISFLLIAHDLPTVRYMAHHTAVMYLGQIVEYGATEGIFCNPLHPYTKALLSASLPPNPDAPDEELLLGDEIPSPIDPPSGCRLHPRCPFVMPVCSQQEPATRQLIAKPEAPERDDRTVMCHLYQGE